MLRSSYCSLDSMSEKEITDVGECPYDQVLLLSPASTMQLYSMGCQAAVIAELGKSSALVASSASRQTR